MIIIAGQRPWVLRAYERDLDGRGVYADNIEAIRSCPKGSHVYFVHWSDKVPDDVLNDYVCIGFHMTDLPFGRGGMPLQNLLVRGIYETKLTAYRMDAAFDAGNILLKRDFKIGDKEDTAEDIYKSVSELALRMVKDIETTGDFVGTAQFAGIPGNAEVFRRFTPEEMRIPNDITAAKLHDFIRAFDAEGYPHPYIDLDNVRLTFTTSYGREGECIESYVKICPKD